MPKRKNNSNPNRVTNNEPLERYEDESITKRLVPVNALNDIKLTDKQLKLVKLIDENDIIVITGPAGCITKNQKIRIYNMKTKTQNRNIIYEKNQEPTTIPILDE